jgi:hypothetical protein
MITLSRWTLLLIDGLIKGQYPTTSEVLDPMLKPISGADKCEWAVAPTTHSQFLKSA